MAVVAVWQRRRFWFQPLSASGDVGAGGFSLGGGEGLGEEEERGNKEEGGNGERGGGGEGGATRAPRRRPEALRDASTAPMSMAAGAGAAARKTLPPTRQGRKRNCR